MWIIKVSGCYLGDRDKLVDLPKEAHRFRYKREAKDHAVTWCLFHQWIDGRSIDATIVKTPK